MQLIFASLGGNGQAVASNSTSSNNETLPGSLRVTSNTGMAMFHLPNAGDLFAYYQLDNGSLIEERFSNDTVDAVTSSSQELNSYAQSIVPAVNIVTKSPLAIFTYPSGGSQRVCAHGQICSQLSILTECRNIFSMWTAQDVFSQ